LGWKTRIRWVEEQEKGKGGFLQRGGEKEGEGETAEERRVVSRPRS